MSDFQTALTKLFEGVEPEFRAAQVKAYRDSAQSSFDAWKKRLNGPKPEPQAGGRAYLRFDPVREAMRWPQYVTTVLNARYRDTHGWESLQDALNDGHFAVDLDRAERDANASVDLAKAHFVAKQSKKLENGTKHHAGKPKLDGQLTFSGLITGFLHVVFKGGDEFRLDMSMIVNYRYSTGNSFYQYPARFTDVKLKGQKPKARISEAWMEQNFR